MQHHFSVSLCCPYPRRAFHADGRVVEDELIELERFLKNDADVVVFPEGFLSAENIEQAGACIRSAGKWVVLGAEEKAAFTVLAFSPQGEVVYRHTKTALTDGDTEAGRSPGTVIQPFMSDFGLIGTPLCYEIHFPEISRIFAIGGARVLINPVGTGMWHELQLSQWLGIARARAIENGAFVMGCTHCCGEIPMAYAYGPDGAQLGFLRDVAGSVTVGINLKALPGNDWIRHRIPGLYGKLTEN